MDNNIPHEEKEILEKVSVPIVTVSATTKQNQNTDNILFSRAHYSMANAVAIAAGIQQKSFWMIDPTNFVSAEDWPKILFTEKVGNLIARHPILKEAKDMIDTRARNKLPITDAIKKPLEYLFKSVTKPIISLHYEAGNILVKKGKTILQVVTDPHVRPQYLTHVKNKNLYYAVFDEKTKAELIQKAYTIQNHKLDHNRVFVTGAPIDPRIEQKDKNKTVRAFKKRPLRLAITTGGLGTNKPEIQQILPQLTRPIKQHKIELALYTGTHNDFLEMYKDFLETNNIKHEIVTTGSKPTHTTPVSIFHAENIVDMNNLLIDHIFTWADGFITKPSGDMAYETVSAGCFMLTLQPWGKWEENIRQHFEEIGVSIRLDHDNIEKQIEAITTIPITKSKPWVELALEKATQLQHPLSQGSINIIKAHEQISL